MVGGHLAWIHLHHGMQLAAEARHSVDASLVTDEAGDLAVLPAHQQGAFTGLRHNTVPGAAALVIGVSDTFKRDALVGADGQHDPRGCLLR